MIRYKKDCNRLYTDMLTQLYPEEFINNKEPFGITFQVTEDCCMACTYCYQHHKTNNKMTWETAKIFIDKLLNDEFDLINTNNCFAVIFDFIGGEPLMEIKLIEKICDYTIRQMIKLNHPWLYYFKINICSNGLLYFSPDFQNFLNDYAEFLCFTISVDGDKFLHDSCRVDTSGQGTYDRVEKAILDYQIRFALPDTKMTLSPNNVQYTFNAIINLVKLGYTNILCNCVFEKGWDYSHASALYNEMKKLADYIIDNELYDKIYLALFQEESFIPLDTNDNENWCGGVNDKSLSIDYQGNMYPCIRYMESSLNKRQKPLNIGNIYSGYLTTEEEKNNHLLISNITRRSQSTDECFYCPIAKGCAWCSGYNYEEFGTPNKRATYICCMHKAQSLGNVYYWNKLYKKLNINKLFKMRLPEEEALKIINKKEYDFLNNLSKEIVQND